MVPLVFPLFSPPVLVLLTAIGYVVATVGMKAAASGFHVAGVCIALTGFTLAFAAEVALMRVTHLSVLYIAILAVETVLVLAFAASIGEGFDLRQGVGAALVLAGLVVVAT
ncbi:5-aminolevulinate synthase [Maliponia aquimaris]|uniref:5-aminolevulinate synthase n=1 Tax=Maliponia aquimaris TaxID=1673631 RepID=A0A238KS14_9RHOB|nr:5-aminolevulinate synthase [Maliponia aquimaris]SMX44826.1 hypothetical protein MAA8898_03069 [Maliponia aquimaris]